ncbi:LipA and NB-ARC domain-containing protein [Trichophyton interdigitale]|uniref:LipA and NB-ARC domain-containing protein n=1 Tax=Trichophyton interdigitale TaxID=101480 RepID=A0A9P4YKK7_9EURO|nr:LipA and NB-ARC domain-containing protein [Trichophyton interdigitale]KAF3899758.1 LipA and NB-ARC domain-containing protein [Trichophyton interdigitale]KAG8211855.1 LipA and NB-ARC domain-containing protein [Trichophyton interdigitale]
MPANKELSGTYGLTVLHSPEKTEDIVFDLVAVHGLNGDAFMSWRHRDTGVMWLKDLLPASLPNARIMTFGYNSKFTNFTGDQDLRCICETLLAEIVDLRANVSPMRPVVFVCHSLGGIIVKKALSIRTVDSRTAIQDATYGILFLATPNDGSDLATTGRAIAKFATMISPLNPAQNLLDILRVDSSTLLEIREDFLQRVPKLHIVSFYEIYSTSFGLFNTHIIKRRSARLLVPGEVNINLYADHRNICRFSSADDRNFRPVVSQLIQFYRDIKAKKATPIPCSPLKPRGAVTPKIGITTNEPIFEVPFARCITFQGRQDLLSEMESYFGQSNCNKPRVYVISGLVGGSGKSQTAVEYAFRNRSRYKSGVAFFNASSQTTLIADFHRIYDMLPLGTSSAKEPNKVDSLKRWFSRQTNRDWLLIFDGIDNLVSVKITEYFPNASWGHIILTSRDQATLGAISPAGQIISGLEKNAAIQVLFGKAAIQNPTEDDDKEASIIVRLLGYLPLAIDQAGAFIRRRQKSLKDYHRLFKNKHYEVLRISPSIGDHEKTVATVWELNFRQLEKDSPRASHLLLLFSFLQASNIPESMLRSGCSTKQIWGEDGEVTDISPVDAGLDPELIDLVTDEMKLDEAIENLLAFSLIQLTLSSRGGRAISVHPLVQYCASHRVPFDVQQKWRAQAILLVAQAFPYGEYITEFSGDTGREILEHVHNVLHEFDSVEPESELYPKVKNSFCTLLLSASKYSSASWRRESLSKVRDLLHDSEEHYLQAWVAHRQSKILRLEGDMTGSNAALEQQVNNFKAYSSSVAASNPRWNAHIGRIISSYAENLILGNECVHAQEILESWKPLDPRSPSQMEATVLRGRNIALGRILKNQGNFKGALQYFEEMFLDITDRHCNESEGWHMALFANLSDLYCELGYPERAEAVLKKQLEIVYTRGWETISGGIRIQLALAESFIRRGSFQKAEGCLLKLVSLCKPAEKMTVSARTNNFLVWTGLARVSHLQHQWSNAIDRWNHALELVESAGWENGFNHGLILYSIAQIQFRMGKFDESEKTLCRAKASLSTDDRKYWIVGLGSYWYNYVVCPLGETGSDPIIRNTSREADDTASKSGVEENTLCEEDVNKNVSEEVKRKIDAEQRSVEREIEAIKLRYKQSDMRESSKGLTRSFSKKIRNVYKR